MTHPQAEKAARERRSRIVNEMTPEARRLWREAREQSLALRKAVMEYVAYVDALMERWNGIEAVERGKLIAKGSNHLDMARQRFDLFSGFVRRRR